MVKAGSKNEGQLSSRASQFPSRERPHRPTSWTAVPSSAGNPSLKNRLRIDHVPRDTAQGNLQPSAPTCVRLTCVRADVYVDESLTGWTLHEWTKKNWHSILGAGLY